MRQQRTIAKRLKLSGFGVHTANRSSITFLQSLADTGIIWRKGRAGETFQVGRDVPIAAPHATVFEKNGVSLMMVEHVMAALWAMGIDNVVIEYTGTEVPVFDGSALAIYAALCDNGIKRLNVPVRTVSPKKTILVEDSERDGFIKLSPVDDGKLYLTCHETRAGMKGVLSDKEVSRAWFVDNIIAARTYGDISQLPLLQARGLGFLSTPGNTIVSHNAQFRFINEPRFENEPFRHKILDLIGDLSWLGSRFSARIEARNVGHSLNRKVIEHYVRNPNDWCVLPAKNSQ